MRPENIIRAPPTRLSDFVICEEEKPASETTELRNSDETVGFNPVRQEVCQKGQLAMDINLAVVDQWPFRGKAGRESLVCELRIGRAGLVGHGSQMGGTPGADIHGS